VESQGSVRFELQRRDGRTHPGARETRGATPRERYARWRDDGVLQVHPWGGRLAVAQPNLQRFRRLRQQRRRSRPHRPTTHDVVRPGDGHRHRYGARFESPAAKLAPAGGAVRTLGRGGGGPLRQRSTT
jgi:hypothetical protein